MCDDIDAAVAVDAQSNGETPLTCAIVKGNEGLVQTLLCFDANVDLGSDSRVTPLVLAVSRNLPGIARILLEAGADVETDGEHTSLMITAMSNFSDVANMLLAAGGERKCAGQRRQDASVLCYAARSRGNCPESSASYMHGRC